MKDWNRVIADVQMIMNTHYTDGRGGKKIDKILVHHNAANLSIRDCWRVWQTRPASAHYQVEGSGRIGQLVWDSDMAWHASNLEVNQTAIGIEHANNNTKTWTVSEATLDNGAHLVAALCIFYKLGRPEWGKNVFGHGDVASTQCPGALRRGGSQHKRYVERMNYWYDQMTRGGKNTEPPKPIKETQGGKSLADIVDEVIDGKWGSGDARKRRLEAAGYNFREVQNGVNEVLSGRRKPAPKSFNVIVREVIAGKWGNGEDRKRRLKAAGYDPAAVQRAVNRLLLG